MGLNASNAYGELSISSKKVRAIFDGCINITGVTGVELKFTNSDKDMGISFCSVEVNITNDCPSLVKIYTKAIVPYYHKRRRIVELLEGLDLIYNLENLVRFCILHELGHYVHYTELGKLGPQGSLIWYMNGVKQQLVKANLGTSDSFAEKTGLDPMRSLDALELYADLFAMKYIRRCVNVEGGVIC